MVKRLRHLHNKGITIFELLIAISVGSLVVTMLLTLMSTTLITRNHVDYMNRLDEEVYYMNNHLTTKILGMNYRSIREIEVPDNDNDRKKYQVILLTNEYDIIAGEDSYDVFYQMLIVLDYDKGSIYMIQVPEDGFTVPSPDEIDYDNYKPLIERAPEQYRINSARLNVYEDSQMVMSCLAYDDKTVYGLTPGTTEAESLSCSAAVIEFNLILSYTLTSGEALGQRAYNFTVIY